MSLTDVIREVRTDRESPAAAFDGANKRFDSLMESQVLPEMRRLCVRLSTNLAEEKSRKCRRLVDSTATGLGDVLSTIGRLKDFVQLRRFDVNFADVFDELRSSWECLKATFAWEDKLFGSRFHAREEVELAVTVNGKKLSFEAFLWWISASPMIDQLFESSEFSIANIADPDAREVFERILGAA